MRAIIHINMEKKCQKIAHHVLSTTCEPRYYTPVKNEQALLSNLIYYIIIPLVNFPFSYFLILTPLYNIFYYVCVCVRYIVHFWYVFLSFFYDMMFEYRHYNGTFGIIKRMVFRRRDAERHPLSWKNKIVESIGLCENVCHFVAKPNTQ